MNVRHREAGFTFLEAVIVLAITAVVVAGTYAVIIATVRGDENLRARMKLQLEAARALQELTSLIKTSGPSDLNFNMTRDPEEPPLFVRDGDLWPGSYAALNLENPAVAYGTPDRDGFGGRSIEMAFMLPGPADVTDPRGRPVGIDGFIRWGAPVGSVGVTDLYAAVIVSDPEARTPAQRNDPARNELQLREYDKVRTLVRRRTLARGVERIVFQSAGPSTGFVTGAYPSDLEFRNDSELGQPLGPYQIRVTLWMRGVDMQGRPLRLRQSSTVNFRSIDR
ncbi:MAG: type II secretion system protein J [Planctomycetota bacterium]